MLINASKPEVMLIGFELTENISAMLVGPAFIADSLNNLIQRFSPNGQETTAIGQRVCMKRNAFCCFQRYLRSYREIRSTTKCRIHQSLIHMVLTWL